MSRCDTAAMKTMPAPSRISPPPARAAVLSACRTYRYSLWRSWAESPSKHAPYVLFIGLNPSTADENADDPTVRRCVGFARSWGYSAVCMANLFAFRATDPGAMKRAEDPVGPRNNRYLRDLAANADLVVAAWGTHGSFMGRDQQVRAMLPKLHCLRLTQRGHPAHPLYLPKSLTPVPWEPASP